MRDYLTNLNSTARAWILVLLFYALVAVDSCAQGCENLLDFLGQFNTSCSAPCECDFTQDSIVAVDDLLHFLATSPVPAEPLDIVPRWNNFYNDAAAGNDGFDLFPTIQNSDLTWQDIKDDCLVQWFIDDELFFEGADLVFNQADLLVLCSGAFPCTVVIQYQGYIYSRTEPSWVQLLFAPVQTCEYGLTLFDADEAGSDLSFGPAEPFEYCQNCNQ